MLLPLLAATHTASVPAPDGVPLHTKVALPRSGEGPWPVLLFRSPYPIDRYLDRICAKYTQHGYACVHQSVRGRGKSGGESWDPLRHERADGLAALSWIIDQPWSDGNIALLGPSYMAGVQWSVADVLPPEVKTIIPSVFGMDMYDNAYQGGMFRHELVTAWMTLVPDHRFRYYAGRDYQRALAHRPRMEMDTVAAGVEVPWFRAWLAAQERGGEFWQAEDIKQAEQIPENTTVPVLMMGGWSDIFIGTQLSTWQRLASRATSTLLIGPWDHLGKTRSDVPLGNIDDDIGLEDSYLQRRRTLDWLDHHLKGAPATLPVGQTLVYTVGADRWHVADAWPPPTTPQTWIAGDGNTQKCTASLDEAIPDEAVPDEATGEPARYTYDPDNPTPSLGGAGMIAGVLSRGFAGVPIGFLDQGNLCEARDDLIGWQTAPLTAPLRIAGTPAATLTVSSSAPDTAFNIRIVEVRPDGQAIHIREGIRALSFREGDDAAVPYTPEEVVEVTVETWPIDVQLQAGSRLRLEVASASFPKFEAHTNTAVYWADAVETVTAEQTIHRAALALPIVNPPDPR